MQLDPYVHNQSCNQHNRNCPLPVSETTIEYKLYTLHLHIKTLHYAEINKD